YSEYSCALPRHGINLTLYDYSSSDSSLHHDIQSVYKILQRHSSGFIKEHLRRLTSILNRHHIAIHVPPRNPNRFTCVKDTVHLRYFRMYAPRTHILVLYGLIVHFRGDWAVTSILRYSGAHTQFYVACRVVYVILLQEVFARL